MPTDVWVPEPEPEPEPKLEPDPEPEPEPKPEPLHPYRGLQMKYLKLLVVGSFGVGKTSLLTTKITRQFPDWDPNCRGMDRCMINLLVDGEPVSLDMWDTV